MCKIVLWGIGERTEYYMKLNYFSNCIIEGFVCTNRVEKNFWGKKVYDVDELKKIQDTIDYIVIANEFFEEIIVECESAGIDIEKIVMTDNIPLLPYKNYYKRLRDISAELYELLESTPYILVKKNEYDCVDKNIKIGLGKYNRSIYMQDYVRYRTFEMVASEIKKNNLVGAVAELGVFRGCFSSLINEIFLDKDIYLFDTFEGFDEDEAERELSNGTCEERFIQEHKDTSVELMLRNLKYPENAKICKGFFPDSISEEAKNAQFAFASIDVDFEDSMYEGLKFFYPRMARTGIIFVHDYNTFFLEGIKKAIERYENEIGKKLYKIPIADRAGTLVIIKE